MNTISNTEVIKEVTKKAAKVILACQIKAMRGDYKFGNYSEEIKEAILEKIECVTERYNSL